MKPFLINRLMELIYELDGGAPLSDEFAEAKNKIVLNMVDELLAIEKRNGRVCGFYATRRDNHRVVCVRFKQPAVGVDVEPGDDRPPMTIDLTNEQASYITAVDIVGVLDTFRNVDIVGVIEADYDTYAIVSRDGAVYPDHTALTANIVCRIWGLNSPDILRRTWKEIVHRTSARN